MKKKETMKKNLIIFMLVLAIPSVLFSAENNSYNQLVQLNLVPASIIGNKGIDAKVRDSLSEDHRKIIYDIEHPNCIRSLCGFNNQVISQAHKDALRDMPKEIREGLRIRVKKVRGSCFVDSEGGAPSEFCDLYAHKVFTPIAVASIPFGLGFLITMLTGPVATLPWALCTAPITIAPPLCAAICTEGCICGYHRCCAEDEIWYSNDNSESDSESKEQND